MKHANSYLVTTRNGLASIERIDAHIAAMESRVAALNELKPPLAKLYNALSDEQKKKADELLTGMGCMM